VQVLVLEFVTDVISSLETPVTDPLRP